MERNGRAALLLLAAVAFALAGGILGRYLGQSASWRTVSAPVFVPEFRGTTGAVNVLAARGDVQAFAILGWHPLLDDVGRTEPTEAAYRVSRPLLSWLAWAAALGVPARVPAAVFAVGLVAAVAAVLAIALLARSRGASIWWGLLVVLLPGGMLALVFGPADLLLVALCGFAVYAHERGDRAVAVALLVLAALTKESALIVASVLALHDLIVRRRAVLWVAVPFGVWAGWIAFVHHRVGAWPWEARPSARFGAGFFAVGSSVTSLAAAAALAVLIAWSLWRAPRDLLTWIAAAFGAFAATLGEAVWGVLAGFSRVLLPAYLTAILAIVSQRNERSAHGVRVPRADEA